MKKKKRNSDVRLPARWLYNPALAVLNRSYGKKCNVRFISEGMDAIKPPFVLLSNHCSRLDWIFVGLAARPYKLNAVVTRYYYSNPKLGFFLRKAGAIPKDQFAPDIAAIKSILATARIGGNVMIFPEGRTTPCGQSETFERSTVKLLRHLGLPVVGVHLDGAYLTYPKWSHDVRKGRVDVTVKPIMTPEEIKTATDDEIFERMTGALRTDDFAWQARNRIPFVSKKGTMAEGMEMILYRCPRCGEEYRQHTKGDVIRCDGCGNTVRLNEYYDLVPADGESVAPANIAAWYNEQADALRQLIEADESISMHDEATLLQTGEKSWLVPVGRGEITADRSGFTYRGDRNGEPFKVSIPLSMLPAVAYTPGISIEMYYKGEFYSFEPKLGESCQRWSSFIELLHNSGK